MRRAKRRGSGLGVATSLVYLFLYAPIVVLVAFSFNRSRLSARWLGFTVEWYAALWRNDLIFGSLLNSLAVAVAVTLVCVGVGTMAALVSARAHGRGRAWLDGLVYLPLVIPEIVIAVAMVVFFSMLHLELSLTTIIMAHITFCISYVIIVVGVRLAGMDRSLEEAALDLGANEWTTFRRVTLPLAAPGILSAALLVFTTSFDDYLITSFVSGVGSTTLPLQIYSMLKRGITPEINAVSTAILLATVPAGLHRPASGTRRPASADGVGGRGGSVPPHGGAAGGADLANGTKRPTIEHLYLDHLHLSARCARLRTRVPLPGQL